MKKLLVLMIGLILTFAMVSCGNSDNGGDAPAEDMISVILEIDFPDESGIADVEEMKLDVASGSSVLDVLNAYAEAEGVEIVMDESSENPYVTSINGVAATDAAGWVYEVNDQMVMDSADAHKVADGDQIDWAFDTWADGADD